AGGTVILVSSVVEGAALVSTAGGGGAYLTYDAGFDGRFVFGRNTTDAFGGFAIDAALLEMTDVSARNLGSRGENPYVDQGGTSPETPYIPGLVGGAEIYGLSYLSDNDLLPLLCDCPPGAVAALCLMDNGPAGLAQHWDGFDMLLMVNLTDNDLMHPQVGAGRAALLPDIRVNGYGRSPLFGGAGPEVLDNLPAHAVWVTLVPEGTTDFNMLADGCQLAYAESLGDGDVLYMVPEPTTVTLMVFGIGAAALVGRRRRGG
ncbi:MAG: hypothetical protein AMK75_03225, partial [Planctomycetes bacterium SM23_65]